MENVNNFGILKQQATSPFNYSSLAFNAKAVFSYAIISV
jgi:hypothetical protein